LEISDKDIIFIPRGKSRTRFIDDADIGLASATILHDPDQFKNIAHTISNVFFYMKINDDDNI
jgi:hypothetical protein